MSHPNDFAKTSSAYEDAQIADEKSPAGVKAPAAKRAGLGGGQIASLLSEAARVFSDTSSVRRAASESIAPKTVASPAIAAAAANAAEDFASKVLAFEQLVRRRPDSEAAVLPSL